jgi:4-amino-4-deoxy-L-arabinose transferase-like glycosyltransferase
MSQTFAKKFTRFLRENYGLLLIILAGLCLRLYRLGDNCLGFDEVGVSYVTKVRSPAEFIFLVRSHVMAMPLDYAVTWLVSRLGTGNAILRLPSAIWGTLTLPVCYALFHELTDKRTALFAVFLLAIAPFHIQYSQELRFYASLTFFYTLSTFTLWRAMKENRTRYWLLFSVMAVTGVFFHMYVLLVLVNALFFFLFADEFQNDRRQLIRPLMYVSTVILAAFLAGFVAFSGRVTFDNPLLEYDISFLKSLLIGLGWQPFYFETPGIGWIWGSYFCLLEFAGFIQLTKKPRSGAFLLLISTISQMGLIIGADLFKHYFFSPRQLLPFYPILLMAAGIGLSTLVDLAGNLQKKIQPRLKMETLAPIAAILIMAIIAVPALSQYYTSAKSNALSISEYIHSTWKSGSTVLVVTPYYGTYYDYFFTDVLQSPETVSSIWQADWRTVSQSKNWPGRTYVIAPLELAADQQDILVSSQYKLAPLPYPPSRFIQQLWIRN